MNASASTQPHVTLNNGVQMPALALGVYQSAPEETTDAVHAALETGYRHIDTAAAYFNEEQVGEAIARSEVDRADIFVDQAVDQRLRLRRRPARVRQERPQARRGPDRPAPAPPAARR